MPRISERKSKIRKAMIGKVQALPSAQELDTGEKVLGHLNEKLSWERFHYIALYRSLSGEVDTGPLEKYLRGRGKVLLYPRIDPGRQGIEMVAMPTPNGFSPGPFGIAQPPSHYPAVAPARIDLVLAPGLAFDRQGHRLGRGFGFYDRWLQGYRGLRVGLAHAFQLLAEVPAGMEDEKVNAVATEKEFWQVPQ